MAKAKPIKSPPLCNSKVLLSGQIQFYTKIAVQYGTAAVGHPFKWNKRLRKLQTVPGWRLVIWKLFMLQQIVYTAFVYYRCWEVNGNPKASTMDQIYMRLMAAYWTLAMVFHLNVIRYREDIPVFVNHCLKFAEHFEENYLKPEAKLPLTQKLMGLFCQHTFMGINNMGFLMVMNAALRPNSPDQITSMLGMEPSIPLRIASASFIALSEYIYHSSTLVVNLTLLPAMAMVITCISELGHSTCKLTVQALRKMQTQLHVYRCLQLIMSQMNTNYNEICIPGLKLIGLLLITYGNYAMIKFSGLTASAMGMMAVCLTMSLLLMFGFMGEVHERSTKLQRELRSGGTLILPLNEWVTMQRRCKALQVLKATMNSQYYIDRRYILTLGDLMIATTVDFLIVNK